VLNAYTRARLDLRSNRSSSSSQRALRGHDPR
jgi:hypothetical protein